MADIPKIVNLLIKSWQEHYHSFLPALFLNNMSVEKQIGRHEKYFSQKIDYLIAENNQKEFLAFTSHGPTRGEGIDCDWELYTLYVASNAQGHGIGSALIKEVFKQAKNKGANLGVWVMQENPFKEFYEKQGFIAVGQQEMEIAGRQIMNIAYQKASSN